MAKTSKETADEIKACNYIEDDKRVEFLSSGSTMFNLAASGKGVNGGVARGHIANFIGDGSSGKTLHALEVCAWTFYNIQKITSNIFAPVKKMSIVYNNVEGVMDFPVTQMYGKPFVQGVEWIRTGAVEAFGRDYTRRVSALKPGEFLLYVLDSWDALTSEKGIARFEIAAKKDAPEDGSFGTEKAKYGSASFFSNICDISESKDTTLIIISQIREKIDTMTFGDKYYRAGGKALDFYTHQCMWLAEAEKLKRTFRGEERVYGIRSKVRVKRNKVAKPFRDAETIFLFDYGIDNILSMINWYYGPKVDKLTFDGTEFDRAGLVKYIEDNKLEEDFSYMVEQEWQEIENAIKPERKQRFECE
jgi:recombination protein RecA